MGAETVGDRLRLAQAAGGQRQVGQPHAVQPQRGQRAWGGAVRRPGVAERQSRYLGQRQGAAVIPQRAGTETARQGVTLLWRQPWIQRADQHSRPQAGPDQPQQGQAVASPCQQQIAGMQPLGLQLLAGAFHRGIEIGKGE